jgi:hypothetical protein
MCFNCESTPRTAKGDLKVKNYIFGGNKTAIAHSYRFRRLLRGLLCSFLCVCSGLFLTSCAPKGPQGTYLKNTSLTRISKVAIVASVSAPKVSYSTAKDNVSSNFVPLAVVFPPALLVALTAVGTEAAIRSGVDHGHAGEVKEQMDLCHFKETLARSFMQPLRKSDFFETTEYLTDKNQDLQQLSAKGYDAVIRLFVREISLKRVGGDNVGLNAYVRGQMEYLSSGKIVWDREEYVMSPELHSLDYYKKNGLKELDIMLEKAGRNLSYDFVYLK